MALIPPIGCLAAPGTMTRWLKTFLHVPPAELVGCGEQEIAEVEAAAGRALPAAYKQMLREAGGAVGRGVADDHFRRASMLYPNMLEVREVAQGLVEGSEGAALLEHTFPFYDWEVYRVCLLDLSEPWDDPPVLRLSDVTGRVSREFDTFSKFVAWEIFTLADVLALETPKPSR